MENMARKTYKTPGKQRGARQKVHTKVDNKEYGESFTYKKMSFQIKHKCPHKANYYQAKGPRAYIWPTNSPKKIE